MSINIRSPETEEEFRQYYHLRWQLLRAPWGQPEGSEKDAFEEQSLHFIALYGLHPDKADIAGVARLQFNDCDDNLTEVARIRYMAVVPAFRRMGVGRALIDAVEEQARVNGSRQIMLHARENAVAFYQALGYRPVEKSYLLFDTIQHYKMVKNSK